MLTYWTRMPVVSRINLLLAIPAVVVVIGMLLWHFPSWLSSVLILAYVIITIVERWPKEGNRHPQENDPNRR